MNDTHSPIDLPDGPLKVIYQWLNALYVVTRRHGSALEAMKRLHGVSTYEARRYLDIYYPPARIKELREEGHSIRTQWMIITTETGDDHRIGLYVLETEVVHEPA